MSTRSTRVRDVAGELVVLAGRTGLVANTDEGRRAYASWLANDPKAARKALFGRVAAQRVAASNATTYPAGWLRGPRAAKATAAPATYPAHWLRARSARRSHTTQAGD